MAIVYTKRQFIQRIVKHVADGFPTASFPVSDNEVLLYIDAAIPFVLKSQVFENAKISGLFEVPDAYLATYALTPSQDNVTIEWYVTLPQQPLALPTGYNITDAYFASPSYGRGQSLYFIKTKRVPYRGNLPKPSGVLARVEGRKIYMMANDMTSLEGQTLYVQMPISRTDSLDDVMSIPDDAIEPIFTKVVATILQRYQIPYDEIKDNLPVGNKTS